MSEETNDDSYFTSWIKSTTQYSVLLLLVIILSIILTISTKNKININFSKKENKRILIILILLILYIYRNSMFLVFDEIKKDAIQPGSGYIGKNVKKTKDYIVSLNAGYMGKHISDLNNEINKKPIINEYKLSETLKAQLINNMSIGYIILEDSSVYSIKFLKNKYVLESKINRNEMNVDIISIDKDNPKYINIYSKIKIKEMFNEKYSIENILVKPNTIIENMNNKDECSKCRLYDLPEKKALNYSTVENNKNDKLPTCYKTDKIDENGDDLYSCCILEDSNTKYKCPDKCFDFPDDLENKLFKADEYVDIVKTNSYCSNISLNNNPNTLLDVIRI